MGVASGAGGGRGGSQAEGNPRSTPGLPPPVRSGAGGARAGAAGGGIGIGKLGNFLVDVEALLQPSGLARSGPSFRRAEERAQHRGAKERKIGSEGAFGDRPRKVFSPKGGD